MINPTKDDIGRAVVYRAARRIEPRTQVSDAALANGDMNAWKQILGFPPEEIEEGVITSFNDHYVFIRYGSDKSSKATRREDLEWVSGT